MFVKKGIMTHNGHAFDSKGAIVTNVGDPEEEEDAVNVVFLRAQLNKFKQEIVDLVKLSSGNFSIELSKSFNNRLATLETQALQQQEKMKNILKTHTLAPLVANDQANNQVNDQAAGSDDVVLTHVQNLKKDLESQEERIVKALEKDSVSLAVYQADKREQDNSCNQVYKIVSQILIGQLQTMAKAHYITQTKQEINEKDKKLLAFKENVAKKLEEMKKITKPADILAQIDNIFQLQTESLSFVMPVGDVLKERSEYIQLFKQLADSETHKNDIYVTDNEKIHTFSLNKKAKLIGIIMDPLIEDTGTYINDVNVTICIKDKIFQHPTLPYPSLFATGIDLPETSTNVSLKFKLIPESTEKKRKVEIKLHFLFLK